MEAGFIVTVIVLSIVAFIGLYLLVHKRFGTKPKTKLEDIHGMLNIVYDEFNGNPQLVLALYDPVEDVVGQKQVIFEVNVIRQNSQK